MHSASCVSFEIEALYCKCSLSQLFIRAFSNILSQTTSRYTTFAYLRCVTLFDLRWLVCSSAFDYPLLFRKENAIQSIKKPYFTTFCHFLVFCFLIFTTLRSPGKDVHFAHISERSNDPRPRLSMDPQGTMIPHSEEKRGKKVSHLVAACRQQSTIHLKPSIAVTVSDKAPRCNCSLFFLLYTNIPREEQQSTKTLHKCCSETGCKSDAHTSDCAHLLETLIQRESDCTQFYVQNTTCTGFSTTEPTSGLVVV